MKAMFEICPKTNPTKKKYKIVFLRLSRKAQITTQSDPYWLEEKSDFASAVENKANI